MLVWILAPLLIVNLPAAAPGPLDVDGQWAPKVDLPLVAVHTMALHNGKYLLLDAWEVPTATPRLWDPAANTFTTLPVDAGIFCSGHVQLPDGRMLFAGGHAGSEIGIKNTYIFDPVATTWTRVADMNSARWYPSMTTLGDGRIVAISGQSTAGNWVDTPEVYSPTTNTWTALTGVSTASIREIEYPLSYLMPDGRIFVYAISTGATGILDVDAKTWTPGPSTTVINGSTAMYRTGKVIVAGEEANSPAAAVIDLNVANPTWRSVASPAYLRYEQNIVVLADGTVMNIGGSASSQLNTTPVLSNEIWDPVTETWTTVASGADPRMYHSTAVLQRDGTMMALGGGRLAGPDVLTAQVYSPPYLFRGPRPTITTAPAATNYGVAMTVQTPAGASVASVFLSKLGSVTHTLNMDPQFVSLPFTQVAGGLEVSAPAHSNIAPPGYYNLWLVDSNGVPSVSHQVKVGGTDTAAPSAPTALSATGDAGKATVSWTAATDNVGVASYNLHRSTSAGFVPALANRIAQPTTAAYTDNGRTAGTYYYRATAQDGAGNVGPASNEGQATVTADTTPPTSAITAPAAGAVVSNTLNVTASASDGVAVAGLQFKLDGANLGPEDTSAPFSTSWNTKTVASGAHTLTAVARDLAGNQATSAAVGVTVTNTGPAGLVGAWSFDEGTGTTAADLSGSGNTGTLTNATWTASGRFGGALSFNGTNATVVVPDANSLDLTTGMTLEAWVRPNASMGSTWRTALMKEQPSQLVYGLYANGDAGRPRGQLSIAAGERGVAGTAAVPANAWTHLAATYNGSVLSFYTNGVLVASEVVSGNILTSTTALRVGGNAAWGEFFNGLIDEVRVYNRALSTAEVANDMNTSIGVLTPDTQAPTAATGLTASIGSGSVGLTWTTATDNVGVAGYDVHRSTTPGFAPSAANRIAQPAGASYTDPGLAPGTYFYRVVARDAAGNVSPPSKDASATLPADTTGPVAAISAPAAGATVTGTSAVTAAVTDAVDSAAAGVQVADNAFQAVSSTITAGSTVTWTKTGNNQHTVTADDGSFDSGSMAPGATFSRTFATPGSYRFYCVIHGAAGGTGMSGVIVVQPKPTGIVAGVQFKLDGANLGAEDTTAPYSVSWDTTTATNGSHTLTATA
ncbi:MAG: LamG-like jellyroll fold domain-containing protein, partial [Acidimicrobiales bacterium]